MQNRKRHTGEDRVKRRQLQDLVRHLNILRCHGVFGVRLTGLWDLMRPSIA